MDQGRVTIGHRLPVEAPDAVAATIRTVRGLEAGLNAGAERLSRPPLVHTLPLIGDVMAMGRTVDAIVDDLSAKVYAG